MGLGVALYRRFQIGRTGLEPAQPAPRQAAKMQRLDIIGPIPQHGVQPRFRLGDAPRLHQLHGLLQRRRHDASRSLRPGRKRRISPPIPPGCPASSGAAPSSPPSQAPVSGSTGIRASAVRKGASHSA